jgi:hypothetical protein
MYVFHVSLLTCQIETDAVDETCSTYGGDEKCVQNLVVKHEEDIPFWTWENNIKMELR